MSKRQMQVAGIIIAIIIAGALFMFVMHNERRNLYEQAKQFDEDVKRGRYTPVEMPDGKVRYEKHW